MKPFFIKLFNIARSWNKRDEDFLTEILGFYLSIENNANIFLKYLLGTDLADSEQLEDLKFEIETQVYKKKLAGHSDGSLIDMVIKSKPEEILIFIENKIGSSEGIDLIGEPDQLWKYIGHLIEEEEYKKRYLIYITKNEDPKTFSSGNNTIFIQKRWYEILDFLKNANSSNPVNNKIREGVIDYMKSRNLEEITKLEDNDLQLISMTHRNILIRDFLIKSIQNEEVSKAFEKAINGKQSSFIIDWKNDNAYYVMTGRFAPRNCKSEMDLFVYYELIEGKFPSLVFDLDNINNDPEISKLFSEFRSGEFISHETRSAIQLRLSLKEEGRRTMKEIKKEIISELTQIAEYFGDKFKN